MTKGRRTSRFAFVAAVVSMAVFVSSNIVAGVTIVVPPGGSIQNAIDSASAGDTVQLAEGTHDVAQTILVNKAVTIAGPSVGAATVRGADVNARCVFQVSASGATIDRLNVTWTAAVLLATGTGLAETEDALIRVRGAGLSGITIQSCGLYVPLQVGAMSTWVGRALTVESYACSGGVLITDNTVYNTRNGIVVQYGNTAVITNNYVLRTKGGVMNYTSNQADADNRTVTGNTWGTEHNEWDIVWNSANYDPNYLESVTELSEANNEAYVVDRRDAAGGNALGNRSHVFVNATGTSTINETNGNTNAPYATLALGLDALAPGGTAYLAPGSYQGVVINKEVHIDGEDSGGAVISSGVAYSPTNPTYKTAFRLDAGAGGTVIDDVTVLCTSGTQYYFAVFGRNVDDVALEDFVIYDTVQGISNWGGDGWEILNNEIIGTVAAGGGGIGFYLGVRPGSNLTCSDNLLQGNVVGSDATAPDYSCPGIVLALDLRYGSHLSLTGGEELTGNRILGNTIADGGVVNGVGIEMGVIMTGIAPALIPDLISDTLGMIHGNAIVGNTVSGEYLGVYLYTVADTDVQLNVISDCTGAGVAMYDGNVDNVFRYNSIAGNAYGLWNETGTLVDAVLNWWGDASGPSGEGTGTGDAVSASVIFSPWVGINPDADPNTPGVQLVSPMLIIVAPVGPEPAGGYFNAAVGGANELPGADTIQVQHGTYNAETLIKGSTEIVSQPGSAAHTTLTGNLSLNAAGIRLGRPGLGFSVLGNITAGAGIDASTIHINWNDLYANVINNGNGTLDALYNFWGTRDPLVIDGRTIGDVGFDPFLPMEADASWAEIQVLLAAGFSLDLDGALDALNQFAGSGMDAQDYMAWVEGQAAEHAAEAFNAVNPLLVLEPAGGGGGAAGGGGTYQQGDMIDLAFTVVNPATGEPVTDLLVTLSVVQLNADGTRALSFWGLMSYNPATGSYALSYDTSALAPGEYDFIITLPDGQSTTMHVVITA